MITRYLNNRWWKMKEDADGQYVAYHDHEAAIEKLRYENDKLWERIAQQVEENKKLLESKTGWANKTTDLRDENIELRKRIERVTGQLTRSRAVGWFLALAYAWWVWR